MISPRIVAAPLANPLIFCADPLLFFANPLYWRLYFLLAELPSADLVDVKAFNGYSILSDHSPVGIQWDVVRGLFWRMNVAILKDNN